MPRSPRFDAPGLLHHVTARGIERREIFHDDVDREAYLARVDRLSTQTRVTILAWALMPNHVHFVMGTELGVLSRFMARLNTSYALFFNRRHGRVGYVFQSRFWSRPIGGDVDAVVEYVHSNPVRAGLVALEDHFAYAWCGHGWRCGARAPRRFERAAHSLGNARSPLATIVEEECARAELPSVAVAYGRSRAASALRARVIRRALRETTMSGAELARSLGIARSTVSQLGAGLGPEES